MARRNAGARQRRDSGPRAVPVRLFARRMGRAAVQSVGGALSAHMPSHWAMRFAALGGSLILMIALAAQALFH